MPDQSLIPDVPIIIQLPKEAAPTEVITDLISHVYQIQTPNLDQPDIHWLNPDAPLKIEVVRQLQEMSSYKPYTWSMSVFIISNLETASLPAQQALLKILEEPPSHIRLLLICSDPSSLLATITSRCQLFKPGTLPAGPQVNNSEKAIDAQAWYSRIITSSYGGIVNLADEVSDRPQAEALARDLINHLHQELQQNLNQAVGSRYTKQIQVLLTLLEGLKLNLNVKLTVEEAFFKLKKA